MKRLLPLILVLLVCSCKTSTPSKPAPLVTFTPAVEQPAVVTGRKPPWYFLPLPPPPSTNLWTILSFPADKNAVWTVFQSDSIGASANWRAITNAATNVIVLPLSTTVPSRFYKTRKTLTANASVTIGWNASSSGGVTGYNLYYGFADGSYPFVIHAGNATQATVIGLSNNAAYYFSATAYDQNGIESDFSKSLQYPTPPGPILPEKSALATSPTVTVVGTTNATGVNKTSTMVSGSLIDTGGDKAVTMFFYGSTQTTGNSNAFWTSIVTNAVTSNAGIVSTVLTNLLPGTTYYYAFAARNAIGMSVGREFSFTTLPAAPVAASPKVLSSVKKTPIENGAVPLPPRQQTPRLKLKLPPIPKRPATIKVQE